MFTFRLSISSVFPFLFSLSSFNRFQCRRFWSLSFTAEALQMPLILVHAWIEPDLKSIFTATTPDYAELCHVDKLCGAQ